MNHRDHMQVTKYCVNDCDKRSKFCVAAAAETSGLGSDETRLTVYFENVTTCARAKFI